MGVNFGALLESQEVKGTSEDVCIHFYIFFVSLSLSAACPSDKTENGLTYL